MSICRTLVFLFLLATSSFAAAQASKQPVEGSHADQRRMQEMRNELVKLNRELHFYKSQRYQIETAYAKRYYANLGERAEVNIAQFRWQRSASEKLLWMVVFVVFSGVGFSGYQLWRATRLGHSPGESTMELNAQQRTIRITSSIVGVAVLAISMAFFYFFLIEVYRIKVVDMSSVDIRPFSDQP